MKFATDDVTVVLNVKHNVMLPVGIVHIEQYAKLLIRRLAPDAECCKYQAELYIYIK